MGDQLETTIKCRKCTNSPGNYQLDDGNTFVIAVRMGERPQVTECVQLKAGGALCERCLMMELQRESDRLSNRELTRLLYRREVQRRQTANDPFRCSHCRSESGEWVYLPDQNQQLVGYCRSCLYTELRNSALKNAVGIANSRARSQSILAAMKEARQQTRFLFNYAWA
jgi:hypothetical protein